MFLIIYLHAQIVKYLVKLLKLISRWKGKESHRNRFIGKYVKKKKIFLECDFLNNHQKILVSSAQAAIASLF